MNIIIAADVDVVVTKSMATLARVVKVPYWVLPYEHKSI